VYLAFYSNKADEEKYDFHIIQSSWKSYNCCLLSYLHILLYIVLHIPQIHFRSWRPPLSLFGISTSFFAAVVVGEDLTLFTQSIR